MTTATIERTTTALVTTDDAWIEIADRLSVAGLDGDLDGATWSFTLKAELEEAFDSALLRAAMADLPRLSGAQALTWW